MDYNELVMRITSPLVEGYDASQRIVLEAIAPEVYAALSTGERNIIDMGHALWLVAFLHRTLDSDLQADLLAAVRSLGNMIERDLPWT